MFLRNKLVSSQKEEHNSRAIRNSAAVVFLIQKHLRNVGFYTEREIKEDTLSKGSSQKQTDWFETTHHTVPFLRKL